MIHALSSSRRSSTSKSKRTTLGVRLCHRDAETRRRRDGETERRRDGEKMRSHLAASPTLCLSFSLSLFLSVALWLCGSVASSTQTDSFEKQALSLVREMPASALDAELPGRPFASWFEQVTGP